MKNRIVQSASPVLLVGGGDVSAQDINSARALCGPVVGADSGADALFSAGVDPDVAIGDFDSISAQAKERLGAEGLLHIAEQDSTDFDKCLRNIEAPMVLGLGFLGARLDHQLAAQNALVRHAGQRCLLVGPEDLVFHVPRDLTLTLPVGMRFSLFPYRQVRGTSEGLNWPIDGLDFAPDGRVGTSNRVSHPEVRLSLDGPGMIAIIPRAALEVAFAALLAAAPWSVPGK